MARCDKCNKELGRGGIVQDSGRTLCVECDAAEALKTAFREERKPAPRWLWPALGVSSILAGILVYGLNHYAAVQQGKLALERDKLDLEKKRQQLAEEKDSRERQLAEQKDFRERMDRIGRPSDSEEEVRLEKERLDLERDKLELDKRRQAEEERKNRAGEVQKEQTADPLKAQAESERQNLERENAFLNGIAAQAQAKLKTDPAFKPGTPTRAAYDKWIKDNPALFDRLVNYARGHPDFNLVEYVWGLSQGTVPAGQPGATKETVKGDLDQERENAFLLRLYGQAQALLKTDPAFKPGTRTRAAYDKWIEDNRGLFDQICQIARKNPGFNLVEYVWERSQAPIGSEDIFNKPLYGLKALADPEQERAFFGRLAAQSSALLKTDPNFKPGTPQRMAYFQWTKDNHRLEDHIYQIARENPGFNAEEYIWELSQAGLAAGQPAVAKPAVPPVAPAQNAAHLAAEPAVESVYPYVCSVAGDGASITIWSPRDKKEVTLVVLARDQQTAAGWSRGDKLYVTQGATGIFGIENSVRSVNKKIVAFLQDSPAAQLLKKE